MSAAPVQFIAFVDPSVLLSGNTLGLLGVVLGSVLVGGVAAFGERALRRAREDTRGDDLRDFGGWTFADATRSMRLLAGYSDLMHGVRRMSAPAPRVHLAWVSENQVGVQLSYPAGTQPPAPWWQAHGGQMWMANTADLRHDCPLAAPPATFVGMGSANGWRVFVDLAAARGDIAIAGDAHQARRLVRALAFQLGSSPWSRPVTVITGGFDEPIETPEPDRQHDFATVTGAIGAAETLLGAGSTRHHDADPAQDGLASPVSDGGQRARRDPLVMLLAEPPQQHEHARVKHVVASSGTPMAVVYPGTSQSARWIAEIDADGLLRLPSLGIQVQSPADETEAALRKLPERPDRQVGGKREAYDHAPEPVTPGAQGSPAPGAVETGSSATKRVSASRDPGSASVRRRTIRSLRTPVLHERERDRLWPAQAEVRVLGPLEVRAPGTVTGSQRPLLAELAAAAALLPQGLTGHIVQDAVQRADLAMPAINALSAWLGADQAGVHRLRNTHTGWVLSEDVRVDWHLFRDLVTDTEPANERARLVSALALIRGEFFSSRQLGQQCRYELHSIEQSAQPVIIGSVRRAAELASQAGDQEGVEWALRQGLLLLPYIEGLWRTLLLFYLEHDPARAGRCVEEMLAVLARGGAQVRLQPETDALLGQIGRQGTVAMAHPGVRPVR